MGRMNTIRCHRWLTGHHFIMTMDSRYVQYNSRSMHTVRVLLYYDIMSWKHFTWISLKIGQQCGALIFSFWLVWISCGTNRHVAGALSCCGTHLSLLWYTYGWCFVVFGCDLVPVDFYQYHLGLLHWRPGKSYSSGLLHWDQIWGCFFGTTAILQLPWRQLSNRLGDNRKLLKSFHKSYDIF